MIIIKNYFYCEGDLLLFDDSFTWEGYGFNTNVIRECVQNHFQVPNKDGKLITMYPVEDMGIFMSTLYPRFQYFPECNCKLLSKEEVEEIHAPLLLLQAASIIVDKETPTEHEVYRSQILLLLTEISLNLKQEE